MELTAEEYGDYWGGAVRIGAGVLIAVGGYRLVGPLVDHPELAATLLGSAVFALVVLVAAFVASLGLARIVRTAVRAEQ